MSSTERQLSDDLKNRFRIYFPSRETVAQSKGGVGAGGTICFNSKWYDSGTFPRDLMRDCKSKRKGLLMHSKILFVRPDKISGGNVAWAYLGSANLSESAWGRLVKDRSTKEPKLNCRNWECGVIFSVPAVPAGLGDEGRDNKSQLGMEVFEGTVPVPMAVPGEEYGTKRPWFYSE